MKKEEIIKEKIWGIIDKFPVLIQGGEEEERAEGLIHRAMEDLFTLQEKEILKHIEKRKKVLNELLSKYNLEVDKHRIRELNLLEESLKKQLNKRD